MEVFTRSFSIFFSFPMPDLDSVSIKTVLSGSQSTDTGISNLETRYSGDSRQLGIDLDGRISDEDLIGDTAKVRLGMAIGEIWL